MNRYKLGIDLATRNIGVCILKDDNTLIYKCVIPLLPFSYEYQTMKSNYIKLFENLLSIVQIPILSIPLNVSNNQYLEEKNSIVWDIGIEVSNYGNSKWTNNFNFYAGMLYGLICANSKFKVNSIKVFNANQWEYLCGSRPKDERDRRKKNTRKFVMEHCKEYDENWSEDECDAYCIAYWLDELKNTDEVQAQAKQRVRDKNKKTWVLYSLERKLNSRLVELAGLDKVRNARRIETVKNIIEGLRNEIENVKKKTDSSNS